MERGRERERERWREGEKEKWRYIMREGESERQKVDKILIVKGT